MGGGSGGRDKLLSTPECSTENLKEDQAFPEVLELLFNVGLYFETSRDCCEVALVMLTLRICKNIVTESVFDETIQKVQAERADADEVGFDEFQLSDFRSRTRELHIFMFPKLDSKLSATARLTECRYGFVAFRNIVRGVVPTHREFTGCVLLGHQAYVREDVQALGRDRVIRVALRQTHGQGFL